MLSIPLDVDRVFRSLDRIKPHIKAWWSDNSLAQQLMEQEEVDLIYMTNGRATQSILDHKAPFEMMWNEAMYAGQPGLDRAGRLPNPKGGMKLLDIIGRARIPGGVRARCSTTRRKIPRRSTCSTRRWPS